MVTPDEGHKPSATRSRVMRRIRGANTAPELLVRRALWRDGFRYRLAYHTPAGRADIAFPARRVAVFIDGCFWHGCPHHYVRPRSRDEFWANKLRANVERDRRQTIAAENAGWIVCRFWEHEVFTELQAVLKEIRRALEGTATRRKMWRVVAVSALIGPGDREARDMEALRDPKERKRVVRRRSTKKWERSPH